MPAVDEEFALKQPNNAPGFCKLGGASWFCSGRGLFRSLLCDEGKGRRGSEDVGPQLPGHVPDVHGIIWGWVGGGEVGAARGQRGANASLVLLQVNPRWPS